MKILNDLISSLDFNTTVKDIRQGVFHTAVLTRNGGLAATLPKDALRQTPPVVKTPGILLDKSPQELVQLAYSESILEAAIGMATINSLLDIDEAACLEFNAAELILKKCVDKKTVIIGHFPFISKVRQHSKKLWVIEKNPKEGDLGEAEADHLVPQADVVAITGSSLTNHTLDYLLERCHPDAYVILLGDTTPLSPVLFEYGVDALSGTKVDDCDLVLRCVSQGANFRQMKGIRKLTMMKS